MRARIRETKILEPVSSTSRRGARAAYHDEYTYPRDFGPRIAYTVSLVSDTSRPPIRQAGREMSASRPYETSPFHPPALFTFNTRINSIYIYIYIYKAVPVISSMWYLQYVLVQCILVMYACAVSASFTPRFRAILKLFCLSYGNFGELMQNTYLRICSTNKSTYESCIYKIIERTTL